MHESNLCPCRFYQSVQFWVRLCFWLQVRGHDNQKTCCMCPNLPMMSSFSASSPVIGWLAQHLLSLLASASSPRWRPIWGSANHVRLFWQLPVMSISGQSLSRLLWQGSLMITRKHTLTHIRTWTLEVFFVFCFFTYFFPPNISWKCPEEKKVDNNFSQQLWISQGGFKRPQESVVLSPWQRTVQTEALVMKMITADMFPSVVKGHVFYRQIGVRIVRFLCLGLRAFMGQ